MNDDDGFLTRWSRRKVQVQRGLADAPAPADLPAELPANPDAPAATGVTILPAPAEVQPPDDSRQPAEQPPPTLADAQSLTCDDDFTRFVRRDVDPQVRNTALKTLFNDPHFNVMDGLDIYIDDYGKPDPLPPGMLRQMVQSAMLGLFADEADETPPTGKPPPAAPDTLASLPAALPGNTAVHQHDAPPDEDTDLRLQPDDDAGRPGTAAGAGEDPGRQC